jgi:hypothetical protein
MEKKEGGRGGAEGWRRQQAGGRGDSALSAPRLNTEQETHSQRFHCLIQLAFYSLIQLEAARNLLQQKLGPRHRDAPPPPPPPPPERLSSAPLPTKQDAREKRH